MTKSDNRPFIDISRCQQWWCPRTHFYSMETSLTSPYTFLVIWASGFLSQNQVFALVGECGGIVNVVSPLGCRLGIPILHLLSLACVALQLPWHLGVCSALGLAVDVEALVAWVAESSALLGHGLWTGACVHASLKTLRYQKKWNSKF
jgi:hypothetical protein